MMEKEYIEIIMISKLHDEARVVSAKFSVRLHEASDLSRLLDTLTHGLESINEWASEKSVIIGHGKGFITCGKESIMISTTGDDVQTKGSLNMPEPPCDIEVGLASIVFGIELREVEKQLEALITKLLDNFNIEHTILHEGEHVHDDSCSCGDHHHHFHDGHTHEHSHEHHHGEL